MKKLLVILMLAVGAISFSAPAQNIKKSRDNKSVNENVVQNLSFSTITLKLKGTKLLKTDKNRIELEYENFKAIGNNKKVYTEKDFQVNGKNPKIIINKTISTAMMENFINSDEEIVVTGFYENNEGIKYKPFNFSFSVNKDKVKKIYFKDGAIYIWDN
ncbi:hypothetical protein [Leptotrichia wadei]|jgi:hypothetical protein|uniref:Uncharacterized protein n=1 Tax=Leptotrichia wadei TaxID=157687 RepID=A0A510KEW2_9FUSO|nr:hypothetical protein [Leptotrichia wadei]BBM50220.1 hypothetical protein JMUB3934_1517 [Leptotrichia wadei]